MQPESASDSTVAPGELEYATGTVTLTQGGQVTQPYGCLLSAEVYLGNGMWRREEALLLPLSEMTEKMPAVPLDATLGFEMSGNAELLSVEVFDDAFESIYNFTSEDELRTLNDELANGTYYVTVKVYYTGKYIPEEDSYNTSRYLYMFRMTVGNAAIEEEFIWEDTPPQYHTTIVRADGWRTDSRLFSPEVTVICSYDELNAFRPDADYGYSNFNAFRELIKQYGPMAFENGNTLLAIHVKDSTGSGRGAMGCIC